MKETPATLRWSRLRWAVECWDVTSAFHVQREPSHPVTALLAPTGRWNLHSRQHKWIFTNHSTQLSAPGQLNIHESQTKNDKIYIFIIRHEDRSYVITDRVASQTVNNSDTTSQ